MKNNRIKNSFTLVLCMILVVFTSSLLNAQVKKGKARLSVSFNKEGSLSLLKISAKYKEGKKFKPAEGLDANIYQVFENDSLVLLGELTLNKKGTAEVDISKVFQNDLAQYDFEVNHKSSEKFKKVSKNISIKVANLTSKLKTIDEKHSIYAQLLNAKREPIEGAEIKVQLQRLFSPLAVGKGIYFTDENGTINVPITEIMPGIEGKLNYEVILEDSDDYGTIKTIIHSTIGKPIKDLSTFDERTMWSPPTKAPWVDLIVPNVLIFGIWLTLIILVINLFRISKHKKT